MGWEDKIQVKKGDYAEDIIHNYLESKGFIVYKPETDGAHGFDRLAVKNKKGMVIAEIKAKARMTNYEATGFDEKSYNEYKFIEKKHNIPVFIFFVDEGMKEIYGNWLRKLEEESEDDVKYPNTSILRHKGIILFSLKKMIHIGYLSSEQIEFLKNHSSRNYDYHE